MKQLIKINSKGEIQGLVRKDGLNLLSLPARKEVNRFSEILWHDEKQKWYIHFLIGEYKNEYATNNHIDNTGNNSILYFDEYELAVEKEIEIANKLLNEDKSIWVD